MGKTPGRGCARRISDSRILARVTQFTAVSDGKRKVYTNEDGRRFDPKSPPIPSPARVTYMNLFVNAVLQPASSYRVRKGRIALRTADVPPEGTPIILQFIRLRTPDRVSAPPRTPAGRIVAGVSQFTAISDGRRKIYTNKDGRRFDPKSPLIPSPESVTYMNLFVNAVLQPASSYRVRKGRLALRTADVPPEGTPIILQFIRLSVKPVR